MFDKFQDYMYYLLFGPLKKVVKVKNQFYILFKVFGKLLDQTKEDIFKVREQSMVISATGKMLEEHGIERDMKRLKGEEEENYRIRLSMKNIIAEKAGTNEGILLALKALGYEKSYIEPYYIHDPERWAEFIVYLRGKNPSNINDLRIIDNEVMKVKPASGKPAYGSEEYTDIHIQSVFRSGYSKYPLCGTIICGMWPDRNNLAKVFESSLCTNSKQTNGDVEYPETGLIAASEKKYQEFKYAEYGEFSSIIGRSEEHEEREVKYIRCNEILSGQYPYEQNTAKVFESEIITKSSNKDGENGYPLCGEIKCEGVSKKDEDTN